VESMIKIEKVNIFGWEAAIRGMRNPMNSWDKSDSYSTHIENERTLNTAKFEFFVGENDLKLMKNLVKAGSDHSKFMRYIIVSCDIIAPLYWWKEYDTYKVGTVANSCSTMHKIHEKEFTLDDFSHEHLLPRSLFRLITTIECLNACRDDYLETKNKDYWWEMIQLLPTSYNQTRTVQLNYQVLKSMYFARKTHKLDEWVELCKWIETLPYFREICLEN
jgi:hypothetical protein